MSFALPLVLCCTSSDRTLLASLSIISNTSQIRSSDAFPPKSRLSCGMMASELGTRWMSTFELSTPSIRTRWLFGNSVGSASTGNPVFM
ncbi:hypothetical protein BLNAU_20582 [Blattamonas nauphoetae]|uniref:Secreted protein n=1 Tax=Blattamonas nauphoetae TaxID=2049346 RepID=A0ABQ9X2G2_9EUKA|nr:hypothetical protein BLNAU_20582 [Blattamonas nauphoetae]